MNLAQKILNVHISKIKALLDQAKSQQNPAFWLFENGLRTPMFMLQATLRIFEKTYNSKDLEKRKEQVKTIEDALGAIDYYNAYAIELASNPNIKPGIIVYLKNQTEIKTQELNKILVDDNWLNGKKIEKINKTINAIDWLSETQELAAIKQFYAKAITKIDEFIKVTTFDFDHVEDDVHELRRRLRWLSIYPQALLGVFQYSKSDEKPEAHLQKYLSEEIINSKFNIMSTTLAIEKPIEINKKYFYALSWIILELGKLKDEGLRVLVLKEAIENTDNSDQEINETTIYKILNQKQKTLEDLLSEAEKIVKTFFEDKIINNLLF